MHVRRFDPSQAEAPHEPGFTGAVLISGYFRRPPPSRLAGAFVNYAPGARTPWKTNTFGQTLVVVEGVGWAQSEGEPIVEIRVGDLVWAPPGTRHWEGATSDRPMTCLLFQEHGGDSGVEFGEAVTDALHARASRPDAP